MRPRLALFSLAIFVLAGAHAEVPRTGEKGIVFTKIANNGSVLSDAAVLGTAAGDWACSRHNASGLIFEVKTATANTLRNGSNVYSWFNTNGTVNGGQSGLANGGTCSSSNCDTQAYVAAVNATNLCGSTGWRLPTRRELQLIVGTAASGTGSPVADTTFFPNMVADSYWTATNFAGNPAAAWTVEMDNGRGTWRPKSAPRRIVVVR